MKKQQTGELGTLLVNQLSLELASALRTTRPQNSHLNFPIEMAQWKSDCVVIGMMLESIGMEFDAKEWLAELVGISR